MGGLSGSVHGVPYCHVIAREHASGAVAVLLKVARHRSGCGHN